ncbi:MAG: AmmeMemoRadiSam system protein B [Kiritimatiellae bacterium]|nr:AmmeMemoRadiSam system protein B [Kiritimatiellia bacterium]
MRIPAIAGTWYPDDANAILRLVEDGKPSPSKLDHPLAIIVPHAGYAYSGAVAARAFASLLADRYDRAIILAPSHRVALGRTFSVEPAGEVATPFGPVEFEKGLHDELESLPGAEFCPAAHPMEHAIDIELPLVKRYLPGCRLGAAIVGNWDCRTKEDEMALAKFGEAFRKLMTPRTLVIISSDFTHYGRDFDYVPFEVDAERLLPKLDEEMFRALAKNDNRVWADALHRTGATICGASALHLLIAALPKTARFEKLEYATSAGKTGDWSHVVGYMSAAVFAGSKGGALSREAGRALVEIAMHSLRKAVSPGSGLAGPEIPDEVKEELSRHCGAFVTLTENGMLRGCIGMIVSDSPLSETVREMAESAALRDPRFSPVREAELARIELEVSVLSEPRPVSGPDEITAGRDGVILEKRGRSAVFLPQVATEQGWDVPTMLDHLSLKAGLMPDDWRSGAKFRTFSAQVFG